MAGKGQWYKGVELTNDISKETFFKICPKPLMRTAVLTVNRIRSIRGKIGMKLHPHKAKVYCPCCETKSMAFVAGSYADYPERFNQTRYEHTKQEVLCPVCRALPRHRILASWCEKYQELLKTAKVLYFAPEYSMTLWMKRHAISYTTADLYKEADLKLDIQETGLPDEVYDVIIANHVLEHVDDFRAALKEMKRILRSGGAFICSFPMDPKVELLDEDPGVHTDCERFLRYGQNDHKRVFGMEADKFLTEAGFIVERIDGNDYPTDILPVIGPADYDINVLFRCIKPESEEKAIM